MFKTHTAREVNESLEGKDIFLAGWVHTLRDLGGKKFIVLRDGTGIVQLVVEKGDQAFHSAQELTQESVVRVKGTVKVDKRAPRGIEVKVSELSILSKAKAPLPLDVSDKVSADIDTRLRERVLDLRRLEMQAVMKIQSAAVKAFRQKLYARGFLEVFTPKIIASATEGGAALFPVIYFGREAFLAQSPQLYKELLAGSVERVFEVAPAWRAEESDTPYHLSEFVSMDVEAAFFDYNDVMELLEDLIKGMLDGVGSECSECLKQLNYELPKFEFPIPRITYRESIEILRKEGEDVKFGDDLSTPYLRVLNKALRKDLYFITDWPSSARPFYTKARSDDPTVSESFDLIYKSLEIVSGSTRNSSREVLEEALKQRGLNPQSFEFFLRWFDYGMPPHAGFGMGLSRVMLMLTGLSSVKDVVAFPRDKKRLTP
ncbi:aspartate--tRNA(Asn) ligase [Sulfodiicoccus acidiphilus]|nr:aspartate--tRNA(Asn) ligase [Sulfodiicoccus acidiphilus]